MFAYSRQCVRLKPFSANVVACFRRGFSSRGPKSVVLMLGIVLSGAAAQAANFGPFATYNSGVMLLSTGTLTPPNGGSCAGSPALCSPRGEAVDAAGNVYITDADYSRIVKVTVAGVVSVLNVGSPQGEGLLHPSGMAVDKTGNVYITDTNNNRVVEVTTAGVASVLNVGSPQGEGLLHPSGMAVDGAGNLYIADTDSSRVVEVTAAGVASVLNVGSPGGQVLLQPNGVALDSAGDVYIADADNNRVVEVTAAGVVSVLKVGTPNGRGLKESQSMGPGTSTSWAKLTTSSRK
jgi:hypothetical protein